MENQLHLKNLEREVKNNLNYMIRTASNATCFPVIESLINKYENMGINLDNQRREYRRLKNILK